MICSAKYTCLPLLLSVVAGGHAAALPDPTRPPDYSAGVDLIQQPEEENVEFNLTAIRIDPDKRSAIINGQLVRRGDTVDTARLLEVHPAHVVLDYDNERVEVRLYRSMNKTRNSSAMPANPSN